MSGEKRDKRAPRLLAETDRAREEWSESDRAWESARKGPWGFEAAEKESDDVLLAPPDVVAMWRSSVARLMIECATEEAPISEERRAEIQHWFASGLLDLEVLRITGSLGRSRPSRSPAPASATKALSRLSDLDQDPQSRARHDFRRQLYLETLDLPIGGITPDEAVARIAQGTGDAQDLFVVELRREALENLGEGCGWEDCALCGSTSGSS